MSLIKCGNCNKEISDKAKKCPHCNHNLKQENQNSRLIIVGFTSVLMVVAIIIITMATKYESVSITKDNVEEYFDISVYGYVDEHNIPVWSGTVTPKNEDSTCSIAHIDLILNADYKPLPDFNYLIDEEEATCYLDENCMCDFKARGNFLMWNYVNYRNWRYTVEDAYGTINITK